MTFEVLKHGPFWEEGKRYNEFPCFVCFSVSKKKD